MKSNKAVASESCYTGIKVSHLDGKDNLCIAMKALIPSVLTNNDIAIVCIGTDRSTGDSLGPFVGMYLKGLGYKNVYGTIDEPVQAMNLAETIKSISDNKTIIALDASLGSTSDVDLMSVISGGIKPGAGVGKDLGVVGDYGICGCVNIGGFMEYHVLQNTRLSVVIKIAKDITSAIVERFPFTEEVARKEKLKSKANKKRIVEQLTKKGLSARLVSSR
jgi:putative sporulation protein YyaC